MTPDFVSEFNYYDQSRYRYTSNTFHLRFICTIMFCGKKLAVKYLLNIDEIFCLCYPEDDSDICSHACTISCNFLSCADNF